ncbi:cobalamin biosynthesis protein CobW [Pedomonas sp. V897]|mgnify:FL=1|uniref:cobalamin biosynthesis protein CobW n=1 Tax=Pedomonas sp. V897 TaxID=3446482 RepID=UPI003EE305A7
MKKVPATVITGFLGAGKTTLIRHVLQNAGGRRLALIINEFGDIGVDADLVRGCNDEACPADRIVELANGCICCTVADDFLPTMQMLLDRDDRPDHIIIETSGLALPKPLIQAFQWPDIRTRATVDGVIAVIDAEAVAAGRFASDEEAIAEARKADPELDHDNPLEELFEDQLICADLVLLNKCDLVDVPALMAVQSRVAASARSEVKAIPVQNGQIDPGVLLGLGVAAEDDLAARPSHHDTEEDHDHEDFDSFVLEAGDIADLNGFAAKLAPIINAHDIFRIKGMVSVAERPVRAVLQGVGPRLQHYFDRPWQPEETRATRLVVIGRHGMDRAAIEAAILKIAC